jgi:RNA recognition motif-containing protein
MDNMLPQKRVGERVEEDKLLKRARVDPKSNTEYEPTRVLFIRGLSPTVSEKEIVDLCSQVGVVEQVFLLRNKGQAFVEFDTREAADFCLLHFSRNPASLGENRLFFSYSGRQQVTRKPHEQPQPSKELLLTITEVRFPVTMEVLSKIFMPYSRIVKARIFPRSFGYQVIVELDSLEAAVAARTALDGQHIYSGCNLIRSDYSPMPLIVQEKQVKQEINEEDYSNVCFLHNMSEEATPEMLFNLFSLYGNVMKVKIFFKKRDMALVQYEDHQQAVMAKNNLHNLPFLGKPLLVSISRNSFINMPSSEKKAALCKDYTNSAFHRYKIAGSKNFQHMFPPSNVLHVSNLSETMDEKFFTELFRNQAQVQAFKFIGDERRMALVKFNTIEEAVLVLVTHHNENINGRWLKISFSKANI